MRIVKKDSLNSASALSQQFEELEAVVDDVCAVKWVKRFPECFHELYEVLQRLPISLRHMVHYLKSSLGALSKLSQNPCDTPGDYRCGSLEFPSDIHREGAKVEDLFYELGLC